MNANTTLEDTGTLAQRLTRKRRGQWKDTLVAKFIFLNGITAIVTVCLIFVFLVKDAVPLFKTVSPWQFVTGTTWLPDQNAFGIVPLLVGSLFVTLGAVVIAVPLGIACAVYLAEVAPRAVREILKPTIEVLAGIPSVVIGFIGIMIAAPFMQSLSQTAHRPDRPHRLDNARFHGHADDHLHLRGRHCRGSRRPTATALSRSAHLDGRRYGAS